MTRTRSPWCTDTGQVQTRAALDFEVQAVPYRITITAS